MRPCRGVTLPLFYRHRGMDFVCSPPNNDGMSKCVDLLPFELDDRRCNASVATSGDWTTNIADVLNESTSCVDWNRYYTACRSTDTNPFHNAVSFDDIGHAWIAIFQVQRVLQMLPSFIIIVIITVITSC